jgi:hypothetical protein
LYTTYSLPFVLLRPDDGPQRPKYVNIINLVKFSCVLTYPPLPNLHRTQRGSCISWCDTAFYVFRCVLLHFSVGACFCSRDLFYCSFTSRQCALTSSHCCDVFCLGWGLVNDLSYWILGILKFLYSFCWPFIVVYTLFTCNYARNNILRGKKNPPYARTLGPKNYVLLQCYFCILMLLMFHFELRSSST